MSEVPKIIEDFLKGNNDAGGTIASLEEEVSRLALKIEVLENVRDTGYNAALDWAADWIIGAQLSGHGVEVQRYANTMAMSIRAAKRGLTPRAADAPKAFVNWCNPVNGVQAPFCNGDHSARR